MIPDKRSRVGYYTAVRKIVLAVVGTVYRWPIKPILFLFDPTKVHQRMTAFGERLGQSAVAKKILAATFCGTQPALKQRIAGITFNTPVGLAAGFDYEARLTQILPCIGFGFQTIGTITNLPYGGNRPPMLGRLPRSKSLMVNKGFKNLGIKATLAELAGKKFAAPIGISIGQSNLPQINTLEKAVADILIAFTAVEKSKVPLCYYELNVSCPNLKTGFSFYLPENLEQLLRNVTSIKLTRPIFIKMPISISETEIIQMLNIIKCSNVAGVIIGNLQKNRRDPVLVQAEVAKFKVGNFSGLPTQKRSDELISLAHKIFEGEKVIIGCGGIFSAEDAYRKVKLGASLVQLITGLVYQGPQLASEINIELEGLLKQDGCLSLAAAVGSAHNGSKLSLL